MVISHIILKNGHGPNPTRCWTCVSGWEIISFGISPTRWRLWSSPCRSATWVGSLADGCLGNPSNLFLQGSCHFMACKAWESIDVTWASWSWHFARRGASCTSLSVWMTQDWCHWLSSFCPASWWRLIHVHPQPARLEPRDALLCFVFFPK